MLDNSQLIASMTLEGTTKGVITISNIEAPYGKGSASVASIGVSLNGDVESPDWKVHIPYAQIDAVCEALQKAKAQFA